MADHVTMDLKQDYRDEDGRLYRKGKGRTIPAALAAKIGKVRSGASAEAAPASSGGTSSAPASSTPASGGSTGAIAGSEDAIGAEFPAAGILAEAGITSRGALAAMSDEQLLALDGIGDARLAQIRDALKGKK